MPFMYILECSDGSYYTGSTWDLERRLWEHQNGLGARHTAKRLPVRLIYFEECDRIDDAFYREKQVQGWSRKKKEALIAGDKNMMHKLAECQNDSHYRRSRSLSEVEGNEVEGNGGGAGFDFAQPAGNFAQPAGNFAQLAVGTVKLAEDSAHPARDSAQLTANPNSSQKSDNCPQIPPQLLPERSRRER